ncbi:MAG: acyltransferase family protein [Phycisphaeraceae bacterium]
MTLAPAPADAPALNPLLVADAPPAAGHQSSAPARTWLSYGTAIRVLGIWAVIVGHVCDMPLFDPATPRSDWWVLNLVDSACRWAVPLFIMLSGAIHLANHKQPADAFYRKRLARLSVPIIAWSAFFMWLSVYYTGWSTADQAWRDLLLGKPYPHLHFIYRIAGLYLLTPMLRVFVAHAPRRMLGLTVILLLALASASSVADGLAHTELSAFARFAPFLGYYLAGYWLREVTVPRRWIPWCWLGLFACILALAGSTGWLTAHYGLTPYPSTGMLMIDFLSPVRVVMAVFAWLVFAYHFRAPHRGGFTSARPANSNQRGLGSLAASVLAPAVLGVYLVHPLFREILHVHGYTALWPNVYLGIVLISVAVMVPAWLVVLLALRIPVLRTIVNGAG